MTKPVMFEDAERVQEAVNISAFHGKLVFLTGSTGLIGRNIDQAIGWRAEVVDPLKYPVINEKADFIIHAAGYSAPERFMADPIETIRVNTEKLIDLLEYRLKPGGKFLFVSTAEVYAASWRARHSEDNGTATSPWDYRAPYIEGKRCGEAICAAYRAKGVDVKVARLALAYGPGTRAGDKRVLNQFIEQAMTTGRIQMRDQGAAHRTYLYVSDATEMLLNVLLHGGEEGWNGPEQMPFAREPLYNVGGVTTVTIRQLAEKVAALTGARLFVPEEGRPLQGAPGHVALDIGRYQRHFDKTRFVDIEEGLRRTIAYQKELYKCPTLA